MAWNAQNLTWGSKELGMLQLFRSNDVSVAIVTEAEVPAAMGGLNIDGYVSFVPDVDPLDKLRVIVYVRSDVATALNARLATDIMTFGQQSVWVRLDARPPRLGERGTPALLVCGVYRQWSQWAESGLTRGIPMEKANLQAFLAQSAKAAAASKRVVVIGDVNLDFLRGDDSSYGRRALLQELQGGLADLGYNYHVTGPTWRSDGHFKLSARLRAAKPQVAATTPTSSATSAATPLAAVATPSSPTMATSARVGRESALDHVYSLGVSLDVKLLEDASSDHWPIVATLSVQEDVGPVTAKISRRDFKRIESGPLCQALEAHQWSDLYRIRDVNESLAFIMRGINAALDVVAPVKEMTVKKGDDLYLTAKTIAVMKERDAAKRSRNKQKYKFLRNKATSGVRRDRLTSNMTRLAKAKGDSRVLWQIASSAVGKNRPTLPASLDDVGEDVVTATKTDSEAANLLNEFYVNKVARLKVAIDAETPSLPSPSPRADRPQEAAKTPPPSASSPTSIGTSTSRWPKRTTEFQWEFMSAGKVAKLIRGLGSTEALGVDRVPISVYKKGLEVLSGPIAHLVNRSLAEGVFPDAFKRAIVIPVHKGGGKSRKDPASYRPVSLLCALSKVLEIVVKNRLQQHMDVSGNVPSQQHGFRKGRSCTTAIASAHAAWVNARKTGKVVGVLAFDMTAAFDLVAARELLPKLSAIGVRPNALAWFRSYMTGGRQRVDWNGTLSEEVDVVFGVRQGSILGPTLFLLHVADMAEEVNVGEDAVFYADDSSLWVCGRSVTEVVTGLEKKAELFAAYVKKNGLVMNAGKTQLLFSRGVSVGDVTVNVAGSAVSPSPTLSLLGVTFDRTLGVAPHSEMVAAATMRGAGIIARLSHHLPRGKYLRQLSMGLVNGKLLHALAAVAVPRLEETSSASASHRATQVAVNDVARTLTGTRRKDHVRVADLLESARLPSVNELAVVATATETWRAFHSSDGGQGQRNPLGKLMFGDRGDVVEDVCSRASRSLTAGRIQIPLRGENTFVVHGAEVWNRSPELRAAKTIAEAKRVAKLLAKNAPI
jgi:hypothetical protein